MTSLAFTSASCRSTRARRRRRNAAGARHGVFWGMIGVTLFGLVFTPVFYVVIRGWSVGHPKPAPTPHPQAAE